MNKLLTGYAQGKRTGRVSYDRNREKCGELRLLGGGGSVLSPGGSGGASRCAKLAYLGWFLVLVPKCSMQYKRRCLVTGGRERLRAPHAATLAALNRSRRVGARGRPQKRPGQYNSRRDLEQGCSGARRRAMGEVGGSSVPHQKVAREAGAR